jgi:predicted amidophosphoribosyltransferase
MAAHIVAGAPERLLPGSATLVPVPLHPSRARRRGFNQAERIAAQIACRTQLGVANCLCRRGPASKRQVGRGRLERLAGPAGQVALRQGCLPAGDVVLVDDVVTTGATLSACASALEGAGIRPLGALAYARTPGR